jgi:hypothetical protein
MKILILLLFTFISCGKHITPKAEDLNDDDGDQILNQYETGFEKYVATVKDKFLVSGTMKFNSGKLFEFKLSNSINYDEKAISLITRLRSEKSDNFFEDLTRLWIIDKSEISDLPDEEVNLYFNFHGALHDSLLFGFMKNGQLISSTPLNKEIKMRVSKKDLEMILNGSIFLGIFNKSTKSDFFHQPSEETIKNKTRKIYFSDGKESKVLYVSKKLALPQLLKGLNINSTVINNPEMLFYQTSDFLDYQWFSRQVDDEKWVLIFTNKIALQEKLLNQFHYQKNILLRKNGIPQNVIRLKNNKNSRVFFRIKSFYQNNLGFNEEKKSIYHSGEGGGGHNGSASQGRKCQHSLRFISQEKNHSPGFDFLRENFILNNELLSNWVPNDYFLEKSEVFDDLGIFWELESNSLPENAEFKFVTLPPSSYVITGEYHNSCSHAGINPIKAPVQTNREASLSVEIESFVEKI